MILVLRSQMYSHFLLEITLMSFFSLSLIWNNRFNLCVSLASFFFACSLSPTLLQLFGEGGCESHLCVQRQICAHIHIHTIKLAPGSSLTSFDVALKNESQFIFQFVPTPLLPIYLFRLRIKYEAQPSSSIEQKKIVESNYQWDNERRWCLLTLK